MRSRSRSPPPPSSSSSSSRNHRSRHDVIKRNRSRERDGRSYREPPPRDYRRSPPIRERNGKERSRLDHHERYRNYDREKIEDHRDRSDSHHRRHRDHDHHHHRSSESYRSRRQRSRSRSRSPTKSEKNNGSAGGGAVPKYLMKRPEITDKDLEGKTEEEIEIMKLMGFAGFDSTKGKQIKGNDVSAVNVLQKRKYRQYMNRKGGFNRPLDFVA